MPYEQHRENTYPKSAQEVYDTALKVADRLSGKVIASAPDKLQVEFNFPKVVLGKTLGERTYVSVKVAPQGEGSQMVLDAYPLDAVNRKLMFGARKGVTETLVLWFTAHLEHDLGVAQK